MQQEELDRLAAGYRRFAEVEAAPVSPRSAELAVAGTAPHGGRVDWFGGVVAR